MAKKEHENLPDDISPPATSKERRKRRGGPPKLDPGVIGGVNHDDLGNAVWEWRVDVPRRRDDDPTIDLLDCLAVDGLSIEDDASPAEDEESFDPYDKSR